MSPLQKQQCQEIIELDSGLKRLAETHPEAKPFVSRVRDALGNYIHLLGGVNAPEFCGHDPDGHREKEERGEEQQK
jgi:hypothetical protein